MFQDIKPEQATRLDPTELEALANGNACFARLGEPGMSSVLLSYLRHDEVVALLCASKQTRALGTQMAWRGLLLRDFSGFVSVPPFCPCGMTSGPDDMPLLQCSNCKVKNSHSIAWPNA